MNVKQVIKQRKINGILVKVVDHLAMVIMAQKAGLDFVFYDCEHGSLSYEKLHDLMVFANAIDFASIVRVAQLSKSDISRTLDFGATGVMVPMIETKEQAEQLVAFSKYPPIGNRSYSGGANTQYGPGGNHQENMRKLNEKTLSLVQIESLKGIANIEEILSVPGIDGVIVGPCDLGISMDIPDNVMDPDELTQIKKVAVASKRHGVAFGIIGGLSLLHVFKDDLDILVSAIDTNILREGIENAVATYQDFND